MKGKLYRFILMVCCLLSLALFSSCDLSHKHYLDEYGYCKSCQKDQAIELSLKDGVYSSGEVYLTVINESFFKFVSSGEKGVEIKVDYVSTEVTSIIFFSTKSNSLAYKFDRSNPVAVYKGDLEEGETYYVKLKLTKEGSLKLTVCPLTVE